jgi:hypothetical protein
MSCGNYIATSVVFHHLIAATPTDASKGLIISWQLSLTVMVWVDCPHPTSLNLFKAVSFEAIKTIP